MVIPEKKLLLALKQLVIFSLIVFPLGQLAKLSLTINGQLVGILLLDITVLTSFVLYIVLPGKSVFEKHLIQTVGIVLGFSLILALVRNTAIEILIGSFYALRLMSYISLIFSVASLIRVNVISKQVIIHGLMISLVASVFLGFVQYLFLPDLRFLKNYGWDDHLFRLTSTYLDPGFTGIMFTFGALISTYLWKVYGKNEYLAGVILFAAAILLTYSRASYIALFFGLGYYLFLINKRRLFITFTLFFLLLIPFLPRPESAGVQLERTFSIALRQDNYKETLSLFSKSPVFGFGYNMLCSTKSLYLKTDTSSHSCAGADSSVLFILATTGVVGFFAAVGFMESLRQKLQKSTIYPLIAASFIALIVHSLFSNSMFYPFTLLCFSLLSGVGMGERFKDYK